MKFLRICHWKVVDRYIAHLLKANFFNVQYVEERGAEAGRWEYDKLETRVWQYTQKIPKSYQDRIRA